MISFVNRYQIEDKDTGQESQENFRVYPTAVYTALLYTSIDNQVGGFKF